MPEQMSKKQPWEIWRDTSKTVYKSKESIYGRHGIVQIGQSECEICKQNTTVMVVDTSDGEYRDFSCCKPCMIKLWEQGASMTDLRKAAEMALEALESLGVGDTYKTHNAASALRQALAQPDEVLVEREACAEIAENWNCNGFPRVGVAEAIRARGEK